MKKRPALLSAIGLTFVLLALLGISLTVQAAPVTAVPQAPHDNTYQALPFSQAWTITTMITTNDNWSGVSGIIGYRGDDLTTATGTDPQTILADGTSTPVNVIANQSNPNTLTSGGVAEFDGIANPVVALQGSGTADAPFILLHVNTTGLQNIAISYNVRDIDGSADNAVQQVALHYRVGATGSFTNVPAGYIADATTGPSQATLVTPITVTLPANADNQPQVQIRIMTTNAVSNDEWVGIDDISITGTLLPEANLGVTKSGPVTASAGDPITYTINLSNTGTTTATLSILTDTLPAEVSFVTYTTALPVNFSNPDAQTLVWDLGDVANGSSGTITVQGTISTGVSGGTVFTNTATASTTATETQLANNTASAATLIPVPDLAVLKTGPASASAGDTITYTISLSNTGTAAAPATLVTDTLPAEVTFVTYTTALPVNFVHPAPGTLVWDLGNVAANTGGTIQVQADISSMLSDGTRFTNTVTASTSAVENNTANNSAQVTTLIGAPDVMVVKTGPASVNVGDPIAFTLTYSNAGNLDATGVVLVDRLPAAMSYVTDSLGTGVQASGTITWPIGTLAPGASGSLVLTATATALGDWPNVAVISGGPVDSNLLNNTSIFTTTLLGPDPFVAKSGPAVVLGGELVTYTLVYGNHGNASADVTLTDTLPISFTTSDIAYDNSGLTPIDSTNTRSWTRTLAAGDRFTLTLALTVPTAIASNTRITNTIEITATSLGNNPIDDLSSASSTVYQIVPISVARAGSKDQVFAVEGQVIVTPGIYSAFEWELQDNSGAITMFYSPAPTVTLGDHIRVVAPLNIFNAQPELDLPLYFQNLGAGTPVAPKPYSTGNVAAGNAQGWLIVISGTLSNLTTCTGNYDLFVNDGSGAADVFINSTSGATINPCTQGFVNGDWVAVTGFSTIFSSTTRLAYEVRPRAMSDLLRYPRVINTGPATGAIEVPLAATITATFNTTMTNVSSSTFLLQGPGGAVAGSVAYNPATKAAVFTPTAALTANALYTATLKAALTADNGLTLMPAQDYVWTFTTHRPTADLSTSTKGNSVNGAVHAGQWVTYTITLNNTGDGNATAVVTDVLSSYYSVAKVLDFTQPTTGTLTWTGVVTAGQSVNLQFVAQVKGPQYLPLGGSLLLNSAQVSEGSHSPVTLDDPMPPTITIYGVYLPLIKR